MMRPRILPLALLAVFTTLGLTGCGNKSMTMPDLFPETVGAWHRTATSEPAAAGNPDEIDAQSIEKIRAASYEGPGKLEARVYQLATPAVALDVVQRWHATADSVFFNQDRFLVVLKWQAADRKAVQEFVTVIDGKLHTKP
ncbi:MAG: hypothetical protein ABI759_00675 [Candidatus Solibacter sp.]